MTQIVLVMYVLASSFPGGKGTLPSYTERSPYCAKTCRDCCKISCYAFRPNTAHASPASRTPAPTHPPSPGPSAASAHFAEAVAKRIAEPKRKVAEAQNKLATKDNPYMVIRFLSLSSTNYYGLF